MKTRKITHAEFQEFKDMLIKRRSDWPAVFSTNSNGELWPWVCNGPTPELVRKDVRELSEILDEVANTYTATREEGGRIFIGNEGAYWKDKSLKMHPILIWEFVGPELPKPPVLSYSESRKRQIPH